MHCRVKHEWCQTLAQLRSRFVFPLERTNDRVWFAESHGLSEWIWVVGHGKQTAKCKSNMRQGWSLYPWKHDWQLSYAANHRWHWWGGERTKCSPDAVWWKGSCAWKKWSHFWWGGEWLRRTAVSHQLSDHPWISLLIAVAYLGKDGL